VDKFVYELQGRLVLGVDYLSRLGAIRVPVLVTTGLDDGLVPPEESRRIHAAIPGSMLKVFPGCGHAVTVENPRGFNTVSLRFLKAQKGRAS
jgi:pimeloyl-ACP methyl ester carboxylesterase